MVRFQLNYATILLFSILLLFGSMVNSFEENIAEVEGTLPNDEEETHLILEKRKNQHDINDLEEHIIHEIQLAEFLNHNLIGNPKFNDEGYIGFRYNNEKHLKKENLRGTFRKSKLENNSNINEESDFVAASYIRSLANSFSSYFSNSRLVDVEVDTEAEQESVVDFGEQLTVFGATFLKNRDALDCGWQFSWVPDLSTALMLDTNAVYQEAILPFEDGDEFKFVGEYPQSVYFSYQSYDIYGDPIDSRIDIDLKPSWGKNPYTDMTATPETSGGYEMLVKTIEGVNDTDEDDSNILYIEPIVIGEKKYMNIFFRIYGDDPTTKDKTECKDSGFVPLPKIYRRNIVNDGPNAEWQEYATCSDLKRDMISRVFSKLIASQGESDLSPTGKASVCGSTLPENSPYIDEQFVFNEDDSEKDIAYQILQYLMIYVGNADLEGDQKVPFNNNDATYLLWCSTTLEEEEKSETVLKVSGVLPSLPSGLYSYPRIADPASYDVRYLSFNTVGLENPKWTFESIDGRTVQKFYSSAHEEKGGQMLLEQKYEIYLVPNKEVMELCFSEETRDPNALYILWERDSLGLPSPDIQGFVYRQLLSKTQGSTSIFEILGDDDDTSAKKIHQKRNPNKSSSEKQQEIEGKSIYDVIYECSQDEKEHCEYDRLYQTHKDIMQDQYPSGEVYMCSSKTKTLEFKFSW